MCFYYSLNKQKRFFRNIWVTDRKKILTENEKEIEKKGDGSLL